jgi:hypothetical protein
MTELEWLACTDPTPMLESLRGKASDRKLRLFACACCRRIWHLLTDERSRKAVEVAERFTDGQANQLERQETRRDALTATTNGSDAEWAAQRLLARKITYCLATRVNTSEHRGGVPDAVVHAIGKLANATAYRNGAETEAAQLVTIQAEKSEMRDQAVLLRDIFGNPFRPVTLEQSWLTPTAKALAQSIYNDRTFDQMPLLADDLEKAGCDNHEILGHCRGPGSHVRGCWVVDLVLGKE